MSADTQVLYQLIKEVRSLREQVAEVTPGATWLSRSEAKKLLHVRSDQKLRQLVKFHQVAVSKPGREILYSEDGIRSIIEEYIVYIS